MHRDILYVVDFPYSDIFREGPQEKWIQKRKFEFAELLHRKFSFFASNGFAFVVDAASSSKSMLVFFFLQKCLVYGILPLPSMHEFELFIVFIVQLLRAIHSLWSPPVFHMLPSELKAAMTMSNAEQTSLLGEGFPKSSKSTLTSTDGSQTDLSKEGNTEPNENDVRNWLKGVRDSG